MPFQGSYPRDDADREFLGGAFMRVTEFEPYKVHAARYEAYPRMRDAEIVDHVARHYVGGDYDEPPPPHDLACEVLGIIAVRRCHEWRLRYLRCEEGYPRRHTRAGMDHVYLLLAYDVRDLPRHLHDVEEILLVDAEP